MGRLSASATALILALAAAAALSACGGGEDANLLPGKTASEITANLDQVQRRVAEGDCIGAEDAVAAVRTEIANLGGVDGKLKANLGEGADRLEEVVVSCEETEPEETETTAETTVETEEPEKEKKPKKEKAEKEPKEVEAEPAEETEPSDEGPTLPPQANGKGEEKGKGGPPQPVEPETEPESPSGGVGPSVEAE